MRHEILFVHADPSVRGEYTAALAALLAFDLTFINAGAYSSPYQALGRRLRDGDGRVLPRLRAHSLAPSLLSREYATTSIISFSAGYALVRELVAHAADREAIDAIVMLDSLHAGFDPDASAADAQLVSGFLPYARTAKAGGALLWIGHTDVPTPRPGQPKAYASTTETARELVRLAGGVGGNFLVRAYDLERDPLMEHRRALADQGADRPGWGADFAAEALVPYLAAGHRPSSLPAAPPSAPPWLNPRLSLGERCVLWLEAEMAAGVRETTPNWSPRIAEYHDPAYRRATGADLGIDRGPWCVSCQSAAQRACLLAGEAGAHGYYASGLELEAGCRAVGTVRERGYKPRRGDLAILLRQGVSDVATSGGDRHVVRVTTPRADDCLTIGGNEADTYQVSTLRYDDPRIVCWVAYP